MPRIAGVDIPPEKVIRISLTRIFGVGHAVAQQILTKTGIDGSVRTKDLTEEEVARIAGVIENDHETEGQLRRNLAQNINRLKEIASYRGFRHRRGLPARGQRTKTNARTRKGPRRVVPTKKSVKAM
jgi:small subunit ribosomal protein S13